MARSKAVANLSVSLTARTTAFAKGLKRARSQLADFSTAVATTAGRVAKRAAIIGGALAGVAGGVGISRTLKAIDNIQKTSRKLGLPAERLIALRDAAELSGVEIGTLDMGLQRMVRRVAEASKGTGEAKDAIKELGLDAVGLARQRPDEQFAAIADAFGKIENQADQVRLAFKLFDSEGVALVNTLETLRELGSDSERDRLARQFNQTPRAAQEAIDRLASEAQRSGRVTTEAQGRAAESALDAVKRLGDTISGVFVQATARLAPLIERLATAFRDFILAGNFASKIAGGVQAVVDFFESRLFEAMMRVVRNVFTTLDELIPWEKIRTRMTQVLEIAADIFENPANLSRVARAAGEIARQAAIEAIPGARGAVNAAGRLGQARQFWIDNVAENLLTSANLTGSAARGLDAAGNAVGLGPIGTDILQALRKIERNTADFVSGAVAQ